MRILLRLASAALALFVLIAPGWASLGAFDSAANAAYNASWAAANATTTNGTWGSGWSFQNAANTGFFVFTSTDNGGATANIDTAGRSWAMFANNNAGTAEATRPFSGGLSVGQTFQISMDNGNINGPNQPNTGDAGGTAGFSLRDSSNTNIFEFFFKGGNSTYTYRDTISRDSGVGFTNNGLRIQFTLTSSTGYALNIFAPASAASPTATFNGILGSAGTTIDRARLFNFQAGNGASNNVYFNSISTPEPTGVAVGLLALALPGRHRRRRG